MDKSPDLCDWEVLQNSESDASDSGTERLGDSDQQLDSSCLAIFQSDYFCLESNQKPPSSTDDGSAVSDNPSWIDPASDAPFPTRNSADFWSDSGSDLSFCSKLNDGDDKLESQVSSAAQVDAVKYWSDLGRSNPFTVVTEQFELGAQIESGGGVGIAIGNETGNNSTAQGPDDDSSNHNLVIEEEVNPKEPSSRVIWWKLPFDLLKYCVFRVSPVWSLSVAAALVGFVILGKRLYKMKRKTHALQLKLIIDGKRVSQFMSHAARLNEAFSLVRRAPIIRPSLPGPGAAPWPVMSMR